MAAAVCLGLMSGTSLDAIDAVACAFEADGTWAGLLATHTHRYPDAVRAQLLELQRAPDTPVSLRALAALDEAVALAFAAAAQGLLEKLPKGAGSASIIGSHGQTVFHDPVEIHTTTQLGNPSLIAARTGIRTVGDFRRADMALGGQGAPLVPAFHHAMFAGPRARVIANIGGIANITVLPSADPDACFGFDTGPGNALLDDWVQNQRGEALDRDGAWAASGTIDAGLLGACLADPYFELPPPKSTGRDYFNLPWVDRHFQLSAVAPADVQRTLGELTVASLAASIERHAPPDSEVWVCGGGTRNRWLMSRLRERLGPQHSVQTTAALGLDPAWIEASAFAWLAWQTANGRPGNLPSVTGARRRAVLGGIYAP